MVTRFYFGPTKRHYNEFKGKWAARTARLLEILWEEWGLRTSALPISMKLHQYATLTITTYSEERNGTYNLDHNSMRGLRNVTGLSVQV